MRNLSLFVLIIASMNNLTAQQKTLQNTLTDTLGRPVYAPVRVVNESGKIEKNIVDKVVDVAVETWDAIFQKDTVQQNAFHIGVQTTYSDLKNPTPSVNLSLANRKIPKVDEPAPVFERKEMTVKFENGNFAPLPKSEAKATQQAKAIVENTFNIDVVDNQDVAEFMNLKTWVYNGEIYERMSLKDYETEEYRKPRVRKVRPEYEEKIERVDLGDRIAETRIKVVKKVKISSNDEFIDLYEDAAMDGERYGVPYAISMAQGILESRGGRSRMAVTLNNLFGIKCHGGRCEKPNCPHGYFDDDRNQETFEKHASYEASFKRHIKFFLDNSRYNKCLACGTMDINCWLYRLQKSGYATDGTYDYKLADIINRYKLTSKPIIYNRKEVSERLKVVSKE